jgi:hypothetical protein
LKRFVYKIPACGPRTPSILPDVSGNEKHSWMFEGDTAIFTTDTKHPELEAMDGVESGVSNEKETKPVAAKPVKPKADKSKRKK